jgi:hypothetical protein
VLGSGFISAPAAADDAPFLEAAPDAVWNLSRGPAPLLLAKRRPAGDGSVIEPAAVKGTSAAQRAAHQR